MVLNNVLTTVLAVYSHTTGSLCVIHATESYFLLEENLFFIMKPQFIIKIKHAQIESVPYYILLTIDKLQADY